MEEQAISEGLSPADYVGDQMGRLATKFENLSKGKFDSNLKNKYVQKMYKKSLENRYYEILQELVTLPGNFERLMSPVSDAGLSKVADVLDDATNNKEADVKNKLVSRSFMTSLRQAFLMGKKWVGIAAVNITGHAVGQKVGLYFDSRLLNRLSDYDRKLLGNLNLAIPHNTVTIDDFEQMISLGGLKTADGRNEFISDRLSGYATAFVDVAKDPYILKLIQSDLVVGTAMLMERIGAGELTPYFLNQPIIIDHLKNLDKTKSRSLFGKSKINNTYSKFPIKKGDSYDLSNEFERDADGNVNFEKSKQNLLNLIRENANRPEGANASAQFNVKQVAIFDEFLKLAKLAQLNFKFTQAYNYDTTKVTSYEGFKRKATRTKSAKRFNIVSSVDKVMKGTFIGDQVELLRKELKSLGAIMKLDSEGIDQYIDDVMEPFYEDEYMSADDFDYVAKKLKSSFLDFLIQTRSTSIFPNDGKNLFTGQNSVASRLLKLKKKYPTSNLLSNLVPVSSLQENGPVTVSLKVKPTDAIDVDMHIGMMRELKEQEPEFYNDLVKLSILQGTMDTNLSIASIVPVEDRAAIIAPVIDVLQPSSELEVFDKEGLFYRNNFADDIIVPEIKPTYGEVSDVGETIRINYASVDTFIQLTAHGITKGSGKLVALNDNYSFTSQANRDFVKMKRYQRVFGQANMGVVDITTGKVVSNFNTLVKEGAISKNEMVGYKKVKSEDGVPVTIFGGKDEFSVFKMVNLYGNPRIVTEYPKLMTPSVFNNNTLKVEEELTDEFIILVLFGQEVAAPQESTFVDDNATTSIVKQEIATPTSAKTYSGRITSLKPNQIFVFGSNEGGSQGQAPTHGAGAAKLAKDKFGAIQGQSRGRQGQSYAIVTKKFYDVKRSSTPEEITTEIKALYDYAKDNPDKEFLVSDYSETNLNGYSGQEMADMFSNAGPTPSNIVFNENFDKLIATQPTRKVTAKPSSFQDAIDKAFEEEFANYMGDDYFYLDLPSGLTQAQLTDILDANNYKKYEKTISTLEDFKKAQEIEKQYPKVVVVYDGYGDSTTKGLRDIIESELTELSAKVGNEIEYFRADNFESLIRDFENGRIPEEFREVAEERLNELGLMGLVGYNPNQLPLFDVVDPITKNRMDIESEYQNGTLKISVLPNGSKYFVLLDGRILDADPKNLGNESVTDPDMKDMILDKAVIYKKTC
jgi:hypothetical protein